MNTNPIAMTIRAKKLGVLIRDARLATHRRVEDCAEALQVSPEDFEAFELGEQSPSLPKLEVLAYYLGVSVDHFWGNKAISENGSLVLNFDLDQLVGLRQRMIGALLRQTRLQAELPLEMVAENVGISPDRLEACEMGEDELALPVLEVVCAVLGRPIDDFIDKHGPVGVWSNQQQSVQDYLKLSEELQAFVSKPINRPYLELAHRLSEMSVDKLRAVGEGILEITLREAGMEKQFTVKQLVNEGKSAYQQGDFLTAARAFEAAAESYAAAGDALNAAEMSNNSSVSFLQAGEAQEALRSVEGTAAVFAAAGDQRRQGISLGNLGAALEAIGRLDEAAEVYRQSAELLQASGENDLRVYVMKSLSALHLRSGRHVEAIATMESGLEGIEHPKPQQRFLKKLLNAPLKLLGISSDKS